MVLKSWLSSPHKLAEEQIGVEEDSKDENVKTPCANESQKVVIIESCLLVQHTVYLYYQDVNLRWQSNVEEKLQDEFGLWADRGVLESLFDFDPLHSIEEESQVDEDCREGNRHIVKIVEKVFLFGVDEEDFENTLPLISEHYANHGH